MSKIDDFPTAARQPHVATEECNAQASTSTVVIVNLTAPLGTARTAPCLSVTTLTQAMRPRRNSAMVFSTFVITI